jgi:type I restriction enzyme S subunit
VVTLSRSTVRPGDAPDEVFEHFSIPAFDEGRVPRLETGKSIKSAKFVVPAGAVLLSKLNPRISRVWLPAPAAGRKSIASTEFLVSMARELAYREWLFCLYRSSDFIAGLRGRVTGTSGSHQRTRPGDVLAMPVVLPPAAIVTSFSQVAKPLFEKARSSVEESQSLDAVRDILLPKLVSGKIRVSQTDGIYASQ